jgi:hypothetical protein
MKRSSRRQMLDRDLPAGGRQEAEISELALESFC